VNRQIIYICGAGRSGTTLLDIILGNEPGFFSAGEINRYFKREGKVHAGEVNLKAKDFWDQVSKDFDSSNRLDLNVLKNDFKLFEYYISSFIPSFFFKKRRNNFNEINRNLIDSIFNQISESYLIDSSKYPARIKNLQAIGFDVKVIFLKRKPSSVIRSFMKKELEQPSKKFLSAAFYYLIVYLIIIVTTRKINNAVAISYEELLNAPSTQLLKISQKLNIDLTHIITQIDSGNLEFKVGALFDGNRIRLQESVFLNNSIKDLKDSFFDRLINRLFNKLYRYEY